MRHALADGPSPRQAPLVGHLIELRNRLAYCVAAFVVAFVVCFYLAHDIYRILVAPLAEAMAGEHQRMIYTNLTEVFFSYMKVAFWAAAFVSFPVWAMQLWRFLAPGLYRSERGAFLPYLIVTPVLFVLGGLMAYFVVFPLAWEFFLSFQTMPGESALPIELQARVGEYLGLVMTMLLGFGIAFELPVALTLMARAGLATKAGLKRNRRFAIVGIFVAAAALTPPDVLSQISLAVPLLVLYEISVLSVGMIERQRAERAAETQA